MSSAPRFVPYIAASTQISEFTWRAVTIGALLGILMMIPLRRALIVREHGNLKYPEGTACAEVLKAGASHESRAAAAAGADPNARAEVSAQTGAKTIFGGF